MTFQNKQKKKLDLVILNLDNMMINMSEEMFSC